MAIVQSFELNFFHYFILAAFNQGINQCNQTTNGTLTKITCTATGNPRPKIEWTRCNYGSCKSFSHNTRIRTDYINETTIRSVLLIDRNDPQQIGDISVASVNFHRSVLYNNTWKFELPNKSKIDLYLSY